MDETLIQAANELLAAGGAEALTMNALAERTGLSRATLYRRYGSKRALVRALEADGMSVAPPASVREKVLATMHQVVGIEGRIQFTVDEVAQAAEVSAMSIYRTFGDRAGLLEAFLLEASPRSRTRQVLADPRPIEAVLLVIATAALEFTARNPGLVAASLTEVANEDEAFARLRDSDQSSRRQMLRYFRKCCAAGELAGQTPLVLIAHWMGLVFAEGVLLPRVHGQASDHDHAHGSVEQRARRVVTTFLELYGTRHD